MASEEALSASMSARVTADVIHRQEVSGNEDSKSGGVQGICKILIVFHIVWSYKEDSSKLIPIKCSGGTQKEWRKSPWVEPRSSVSCLPRGNRVVLTWFLHRSHNQSMTS